MGNFYFGGQKVCPAVQITDAQPVISSLNITPTTSAQTITAPSGTDGYSPITVSAVTASIDNNIVAGNIKSGVSILGVAGNVTQLVGETRSVSITSTSGNTFTPSSGKNGITSITVTPTNQAKTITPTTSQQTISVPSGYSGFGTLTVNAVTSSIDANITAGNIVDGVTILGVTGTAEESNTTQLSVTPTTSAQTLTPSSPYNGFDEVSVSAVTSSIDANITAGNIKSGVSILGVNGSLTELNGTTLSVTPTTSAQSLTPTSPYNGYTSVSVSAVTSSIDANITAGNIKDGVTILGVTGNYSGGGGGGYGELPSYQVSSGVASKRSLALTGTEFSNITSVGSSGMTYAFRGCSGLTGTLNLSSITSIQYSGMSFSFAECTGITSIDFSSLAYVAALGLSSTFYNCTGLTGEINFQSLIGPNDFTFGVHGSMQNIFIGCTKITSVKFPVLSIIMASDFNGAFAGCSNLSNIYFNGLTTTSFQNTGPFSGMFNTSTASTSGTCTVHFPSNLQNTISGLSGYPTFGGNSSRIVLSFDLPETS